VSDRATSCYCSMCHPPCSWCTDDARECPGCGGIFDRLDVLKSGYCPKCEITRLVEIGQKSWEDVVKSKRDDIFRDLFKLDE
jgi:hypothetical protein